MSTPAARTAGFTLIELIIAVSIFAILLSIGIPAFTSTINNNRIVTASNDLVTAFSLARSEATKRSAFVTVCPSNADQTACNGTTNWGSGWIVFVDDGATIGSFDAGETKIQVWPANSGGVSITSSGTFTYLRYRADGTPDNASSIMPIDLTRSGCSGDHARTVAVNTTGRANVKHKNCP